MEGNLQDLENGSAQEIKFSTLGKLCVFFQCTPNDLFLVELDETEKDLPPTEEERRKAAEIIKRAFARAEAMPPLPPDEIWKRFQESVEEIRSQLEASLVKNRKISND